MRKIVVTFGLIAGGIMAAMMALAMAFVNQLQHSNASYVVGYASMVLAFLMVFFGIRTYRDTVAGGTVGFGRAFAVGLLITLIATACYVATWEVIYYNFMPDFMDKYAAAQVERVKKSGASEAKIAETEKAMAQLAVAYRNPLVNIAYTSIEPLPVGLLFTLVAAFAFSRKKKEETGVAVA
jgi:hypothetical protein